MGFTVVHGSPQTIWAPMWNTDTLYVGQLVRCANEGIMPLSAAAGVAGITDRIPGVSLVHTGSVSQVNNVPYGVIIGTNKKTPSFDSTQKTEKITYVVPSSASYDDYAMVEGPWAKGDLQSMVKIALITSETVLRGPLYTDSVGTAPTVGTFSGTPTTVTGTVSSALEETGLKGLGTVYFRSGNAMGAYRVTDDTSTTVIAWDLELVTAPASGDTVVRIMLRPNGLCRMQTDTEALFIDTGATLSSSYWLIDVIRLDLAVAGGEYCEFRFNPNAFLGWEQNNT